MFFLDHIVTPIRTLAETLLLGPNLRGLVLAGEERCRSPGGCVVGEFQSLHGTHLRSSAWLWVPQNREICSQN